MMGKKMKGLRKIIKGRRKKAVQPLEENMKE